MTLATLFAALSGFVILPIAGRALGAENVDGFQAFWALFFALGGVANGLMQETTRAVRSATTVTGATGAAGAAGAAGATDRGIAQSANGATAIHEIAVGPESGLAAGRAIAAPSSTPTYPLARTYPLPRTRNLLWSGLAVGLALATLVALSGPAWHSLGLDPHGGAAVAILAAGICSFSLQAAVAGALSGTQRWNIYAVLLTIDAGLRLLAALAAWALGVPHLAFEITTVVGALTWIGMVAALPAVREALRSPIDVGPGKFWTSTIQAMAAGAGTSVMVTGFPLLVTATAGAGDDRVLMGATINAILLTRAPLLVPLTSFQSAIIVWFVERREQGLRALGIPFSAVIGVGVVGAAAAWIVADPIVRLIYGDEFGLPGAVFAGLTAASVGTAALMISGNAALAFERHAVFNIGWWVAVAASVGLLLVLPLELDTRATLALLAGPIVGAVVHCLGIAAGARTARREAAAGAH
nr:hypothetical protein [Dietzia timorensis]